MTYKEWIDKRDYYYSSYRYATWGGLDKEMAEYYHNKYLKMLEYEEKILENSIKGIDKKAF